MNSTPNTAILDLQALSNIPNEIALLSKKLEQFMSKFSITQNNPKDEKDFISVREVSKILDISVSHIYFLTHSKQIPFYKPNGKRLYFKKSEIENWLNANKRLSSKEINEQASNYISNKIN